MIDLGADEAAAAGRPAAPLRGFVPRAAALQGNAPAGGGGDAPKSNADFRSMFLPKKTDGAAGGS